MVTERLKDAPILIVDDKQANVDLLESFLEDDGYTNFTGTTDSRRALALFESLRPDIVLLDLHMPHLDGFEVMRQLKTLLPAQSYLPILVLTADTNPETKQRALAGGATDFLAKPLDIVEVQLRIRNLLETRFLHLRLQEQNLNLKGEVRASTIRFRTLAETASDAIITVNEEGRIVFNNPAAEQVFGHAPGELTGANITSIIPAYEAHTYGGGRRAGAERNVVEMLGRRRDGSEFPMEISAGMFEQDGARFRTVIARDVSERKRAEEELRREREERLVALERVRTRIATDLHDDIGASLSQVAIMSEVARQQLDSGGGDVPSQVLIEIADTARELLDSMSDIVWAVDPRRDDLRNVVQRIRQFASGVFRAAGIKWEFPAPSDAALEVPLSAEQRRHLLLLFKEAINNIARHSGCTFARLSIEVGGEFLIGEISDDGCGVTGEPHASLQSDRDERGGNGLRNMQERAAQLGGRLEMASSQGGGTRLVLQVPLGIAERARVEVN